MSDDNQQDAQGYVVAGVNITVVGGGYYDLSVPGRDVERVRGKEAADARALAIAAELQTPEGTIAEQGSLDAALAGLAQPATATATAESIEEELARLRADNAALRAQVATVQVTEGDVRPVPRLEAAPNKLNSVLPDDVKAALGVGFTRIILEDNPDIPPTGLFVSHNGRSYMIATGQPVDVPDFIIEVLDHATISLPVTDSKSQKVLGYRDRSKYSYRRVT